MAQPVQSESRERGHLMAGLLVILAMMFIFSTVIFQEWQEVLRHDNEAEMMFRAQDIVRAILRYRKDHGTTPDKLEELMKPGPKGQYYLRQQWTDPLVKDGKWGLLYAGPGGTIIDPSAQGEAINVQLSQLGNISAEDLQQMERAQRDELKDTLQRRQETAQGVNPDDARTGLVGTAGNPVGLRIAGVKTLCEDKPFRVYKGFDQYRQWLFTYLELTQMQVPGQRGGPRGQGGQGGRPGSPGLIRPASPNQGNTRGNRRRR